MSNDLSRRSARAKADRILEQALKHELSAVDSPLTPACLDAETLAAWEDGALDATAMELAEVHLSTCGRCQSMVGALARGTEAPTSALGTKAPGTLSSWRWWLAPLAAATAAVTLWIVVPQQQEVAIAPPAVPATAQDPPSPRAAEAPAAAPVRPSQPAETKNTLRDRREIAAPAASGLDQEKLADLSAKKEVAVVSAPAASPVAPAAPAVTGLQKSARFAAAPVEVIAPDSIRRWRVLPTGVEYSTDRGLSWIPVRAPGNESITGGIGVSGTVCWLIGRSGVVLVTTDGMTFAKVDLPVRVDVTSIAAADARSATVTTADGRTFRTDDSGRTWRQNQAQ